MISLARIGRLSEAKEIIRITRSTFKDSAIYCVYIAVFYLLIHKFEESERYAKRALDISPNDISAWILMAQINHALKRYDLAERYYSIICEKAENQVLMSARRGWASMLYQQGVYTRALDVIEHNVSGPLYDDDALYIKALCLDALGRRQELLECLKIIKLSEVSEGQEKRWIQSKIQECESYIKTNVEYQEESYGHQ
jgi:tetratricopeptide (TPR) repeat protein